MVPILEEQAGMICGTDFKVGYSPERVNPGDDAHSIDKITTIVSGMDEESTLQLAELYGLITHVFLARDIKTAEAAKVIENIQRDINIALMSELSLIFHKMGLSTKDVLEAAGTKWNFHKYTPGLVGGLLSFSWTPTIWSTRRGSWDTIPRLSWPGGRSKITCPGTWRSWPSRG